MTDDEAELLRVVQGTLLTNEARLFDHISATFRWLMATLFAANGGAIIGLLGWSDADKHGGYAGVGWFAAGLVLSILMGTTSAIVSLFSIKPILTARLAIDQALITREVPDQQVLDDLTRRNRWDWKTWTPSYCGGASLATLIVGMLEIASRL